MDELEKKLHPHFKFIGQGSPTRAVDESKEAKASYLVVLVLTMESLGIILQRIYEGTYEQIIVCDDAIHDFNIRIFI
ncbi:MAG: hypothetical protein ACRC80_32995, partial [Waterburya sp.]